MQQNQTIINCFSLSHLIAQLIVIIILQTKIENNNYFSSNLGIKCIDPKLSKTEITPFTSRGQHRTTALTVRSGTGVGIGWQ